MKIFQSRVVFAIIALLFCVRSTPASQVKPEMVLQVGHSAEVKAVAYSSDGKFLASAGEDFQVRLWNTQTRGLHRVLGGVADEVCDVAWSLDGKTIVAAIGDGSIALWNLSADEPQIWKAHTGPAYAIALSPDGKSFASCGADGRVRLWDFEGRSLRGFSFPEKTGVSSLAFSPDGSTLVCGSGERHVQSDDLNNNPGSKGTIGLWNMKTSSWETMLRGHKADISALAFSPDGSTLLSSSADATARLWDLKTFQARAILKGHTLRVTDAVWARDGKTVLTGSDDATLKIWNAATGKGLRTLTAHEGQSFSVAVSPDGKTIATGSDDKCVRLWNLASGKVAHKWPGEMNWIESLAVSPRGDLVAAGYWAWLPTEWDEAAQERDYNMEEPTAVRLWDLNRGEMLRILPPLEGNGAAQDLFFSSDGSTLLDNGLTQWNVADGVAQKVERFKKENESVETLALSADNNLLAALDQKGLITVWDFQTGKRLWLHNIDSESWGDHTPLVFSPDGKFLAACVQRVVGSEKTGKSVVNQIEVREALTGKMVHQQQLRVWRTLSLAWSPDGSTLAAGSRDGSLRLWNARTFQLQKTIQVARREINNLAYSPDGSTLAAATDDGKIHLLDASSRKIIGELIGHAMWVTAIRFSPDGKRLVSGSSDNTIKIWDLSKRKLLLTLQTLPNEKRDQISDQWIAFTPGGYYTGSKDCEKYIRWRVGDELFSAEKFKVRFRRPDLVQAALSE